MSQTARSRLDRTICANFVLALFLGLAQMLVYSNGFGKSYTADRSLQASNQGATVDIIAPVEDRSLGETQQAEIVVATEQTPVPLFPQCSKHNPLVKTSSSLKLYDEEDKIAILGMPKGGATIATQLMFQYLNLTQEAKKFSPWIHDYRIQVFEKDMDYLSCRRHCHVRNTTEPEPNHEKAVCIKIVRSPLDRLVSSYIHVMRSTPKKLAFRELDEILERVPLDPDDEPEDHPHHRQRATFAQFVRALQIRSTDPKRKTKYTVGQTHFTSQSTRDKCDTFAELLPLESIQDGLDAINDHYGISMTATGLTSSHYVEKDTSDEPKVARLDTAEQKQTSLIPFRKLETLSSDGKAKLPAYDHFFHDKQLNSAICQLLCEDYHLYAKACANSLLEGRTETAHVCEAERRRVQSICTIYPVF